MAEDKKNEKKSIADILSNLKFEAKEAPKVEQGYSAKLMQEAKEAAQKKQQEIQFHFLPEFYQAQGETVSEFINLITVGTISFATGFLGTWIIILLTKKRKNERTKKCICK